MEAAEEMRFLTPAEIVDQGLRIHDLRHTAVALWIAAGATPKVVAVRVGHTSVSFTLDRHGYQTIPAGRGGPVPSIRD